MDIDDEVLEAARCLAQQRSESLGKVVSELVRQALMPQRSLKVRNGVPLLPVEGKSKPVTMELVNGLRDDEMGA